MYKDTGLTINAYNEEGKTWLKNITIEDGTEIEGDRYSGTKISFGWPCEYYFQSLKIWFENNKEDLNPRKHFYIDAMGRNHNSMSGVFIHMADLEKIFEKLGSPVELKK